MGVEINKKTITGVTYTWDDLGADYIDEYYTNDWERFGKADLIQLNPYGTESLPDFILGIVDNISAGDGDRAAESDKASITEAELNIVSANEVSEIIKKHQLPLKEIKTYNLVYFT